MIEEKKEKRSFRHIGYGIPSPKGLKDTVEALVVSGAVIVRQNKEGSKFFLKLNEGDVTELELYLSDDVTGIHFDKSVGDLEDEPFAVGSRDDGALEKYSDNMFFAPITAYKEQIVEIEMAFYVEPFDWIPWIPKIEEAYKGNDPLEIDVPEEEWDRLFAETEEAQSLKDRLSSGAASLIHLIDDGSRTYVLLARICGRCQSC